MPQTIHFNTGRKYTEHGQRITATLHEGGRVTFYDHDRMIDGEFPLPVGSVFCDGTVMRAYDGVGDGARHYHSTSRSSRDATCIGGCNAVWLNEAGERV